MLLEMLWNNSYDDYVDTKCFLEMRKIFQFQSRQRKKVKNALKPEEFVHFSYGSLHLLHNVH